MTTEQMDASDDYWRKRLEVPELEGATTVPLEGVMLGSAGEFAARWNGMEPAQREVVWKRFQSSANDGYRCHIEDHESLKAELSDKNAADWQAFDQIENLLADELYDGGLGAKSDSEMEEYRKALALKLLRSFGRPLKVTPVGMNQRAAFTETMQLAWDRGMHYKGEELVENMTFGHLMEMHAKMATGHFSPSKTGRWLGWAQAAVVASGVATLEEMKAINQKHADA